MASTILDVAERAGVSTATVSRALRGMSSVSSATREKILNAARELGYVVSPTAQALATGKTGMIALVVPSFSEWYCANVLDGAQRRFQSEGLSTVVHSVENLRGKPRLDFDLELLRRRVDGVVVVGMSLTDSEIQAMADLEVPVVMVGNHAPPFVTVGLDDVEVGRMAVEHLTSLGHKVIGHVSGSDAEISPVTPGGARKLGWEQALEDAGLEHGEDLFTQGYFDVQGGRDATLALIDRRPDISAIFAAADCMAMGAIIALEERGLRVPEDISVIGVDGEEQVGWRTLSTIVQHPDDQGRLAADAMIAIVNGGGAPEKILVHGVLERGRTTSIPSKR